MRLLLILLALLQPVAPPAFVARLDSPGAATIQWNQQARACLWAAPRAFVGCYDGNRHVVVTLGHQGPLSGDLRPEAGTVYVLEVDGVVYRAPVRRALYFPVWR